MPHRACLDGQAGATRYHAAATHTAYSVDYYVGVQPESFRALVRTVVEDRRSLTRAEARTLLTDLLATTGETLAAALTSPLAALLSALAARGETADELCGFAEAMRAAATPLPLAHDERERLIDTCGTGGDGLDTLNISTAAALVAAGAGAWVAKHGNRAVTSRCGSADVLEALGVPIELDPETAVECLRSTGFMFLLAPALHPAMRLVAPVRRALPFRTIFNLAAPLANPARAAQQLVGVYSEERLPVMAEALRLLGVRRAWVVHGRVQGEQRGLDELTVTGESLWAAVEPAAGGVGPVRRGVLWPESLGLRLAPLSELRGRATPGANAILIEAILRGKDRSAGRDIVLLNAGAALVVAGIAPTLAEGVARATDAVETGDAAEVLGRLRNFQARASVARFRERHGRRPEA